MGTFSSWVVAAVVTLGVVVPPTPVPVTSPHPEPPELTAASWVLYDATGDVVLAEHDADVSRADGVGHEGHDCDRRPRPR